jgi:hypothetical protein
MNQKQFFTVTRFLAAQIPLLAPALIRNIIVTTRFKFGASPVQHLQNYSQRNVTTPRHSSFWSRQICLQLIHFAHTGVLHK